MDENPYKAPTQESPRQPMPFLSVATVVEWSAAVFVLVAIVVVMAVLAAGTIPAVPA
ncbi:MAG TPA: hypothetical protein VHC22_14945 [Pirellulales bacterium]|nr:hypothetical protein [Pirellulales bacterium]